MSHSSDIQATFIEAGAVDDDAISTAATVAEDAPMTLTTSPYVPDQPRKITLHSVGDSSGISYTVVGLDETGAAATESITGPAAGATVTSTKYYSSVTSITAVGTPTGNQKAGISASIAAPIFRGDLRMRGMYAVNTGTAGTINFTQGSASGASQLKFNTVAAANSTEYPSIPQDGIVFRSGGYVVYDVANLSSITVFYA